MADWSWGNEFEDFGDESKEKEGTKEGVIFLVDCCPGMFQQNGDGEVVLAGHPDSGF